jgi:hypothetical protein
LSYIACETGWNKHYVLWELPYTTAIKLVDAISLQRYDDKANTYLDRVADKGKTQIQYLKVLEKQYGVDISSMFRG